MAFSQLIAILTVILLMPTWVSGDSPRNRALASGWRAYQAGDLASALTAYQEAANASPDDASLWYDLGCLYALRHDVSLSRSAFQRALLLNPRLAAAHDALGQLYEQEGHLACAHAFYVSADAIEPGNVKFLRHLSRALLRLNQLEAARQSLQQLLNVKPSDLEARYELGVLELRANAPDLAIHEFHYMIERVPDHVLAWNGLALAYARIDEFGKASDALDHALALQPKNANTQTNLGVVWAYQARWGDARHAWERALELEPGFAPAAKNLNALDGLTTPSSP